MTPYLSSQHRREAWWTFIRDLPDKGVHRQVSETRTPPLQPPQVRGTPSEQKIGARVPLLLLQRDSRPPPGPATPRLQQERRPAGDSATQQGKADPTYQWGGEYRTW
jgi:hypothetical protein